MTEARKARREQGLPSTFAIQTDLRNQHSELKRLLASFDDYQIDGDTIQLLKAITQDKLADTAEALFRLTAPTN
jgi:hypothetical protein